MKYKIVYQMGRKILRRLLGQPNNAKTSNMSTEETARDIIIENQFMTLSTSHNDIPWAAPVWYSIDNQCNLYFVSYPESRHCQNIYANDTVAVTIFDSTQIPGLVNGLQIQGKASRVVDDDIYSLGKFFWTKRWAGDDEKAKDYIESSDKYKSQGIKKRKFYKVVIDELYTVDQKITDMDVRVQVNLVILRELIAKVF
jgi:uncharacterized protein YhbP (UPF0306 family)